MDKATQEANAETRQAWEANAAFWDEKMGEGNDFANLLCWPAICNLLEPKPGDRTLDIACGNGLFARRLGGLGVQVAAFDFSENLISLARQRTLPALPVTYQALDATAPAALQEAFSGPPFDSALCNMALFDIADVEPLFDALPRALKPGSAFVFTLTHPAFNNTSAVHVVEEMDLDGEMQIVYSVKVSRYMTPSRGRGIAIRGQPKAQFYFDRPLQYYLQLGFKNGFVLDGFEERAFEADHPQKHPLGWGGKYHEIPSVLAARLRRAG